MSSQDQEKKNKERIEIEDANQEVRDSSEVQKPVHPWKLLKSLNRTQYITFIAAFLGWTLDAFDFFIVSFALPYIANEFNKKPSEIASSITVTLMLRPVGALIFGQLADRYGRKYPLMFDILLYSVVELASGFSPNFEVFIILRGIFGIAMGGEWGLGAALAMEVLPPEARILQQGYATGYLIAAVFYYIVIVNLGWRAMFWIGSFPAFIIILFRFFVPESPMWERQHANEKASGKNWWTEVKSVFTCHWIRIIHTVCLMACFNFISHGTQDLYPTFLKTQLHLSAGEITLTLVIANIGAIIGGTLFGFYSQYWGRRRAIVIAAFLAGCFLPLFVLPRNRWVLSFGAFMVYFFVQGAWGVVPAHLNELSPPDFRGTFPGLTYQLGNLIAASSSQIEASLGEKFPQNGEPDYGLTQAIFVACALVLLIFFVSIGKEAKGIDLSAETFHERETDVDPTGETQVGLSKEVQIEKAKADPLGVTQVDLSEVQAEKAKEVDPKEEALAIEKTHVDS
ncbi:15481_t:CDS:2 [Acaulospora morrowiae]|uniref:15481_t:CDS:1 n=1 Tax=Acaulospora morrowiae TaxID=94023 RepID=A0A9N9AYJ9_9GLOM|nr:15481_t:CDS:2 [Acaulospora morrowiae]